MEVMNIKELAEYLKISVSTIRRLIGKKQIPFFQLSNQYFFDKEVINSWISNQIERNYARKE